MTETGPSPTFNLWTDPWMSLERPDGGLERVSLEQALLGAHTFVAIYDASPLVVVGLHRLLVAILQSALDPRTPTALLDLVAGQRFPPESIADFGAQFAQRFDLFSEPLPFLQSADLPLLSANGEDLKSVSQLTLETSRTSALEHYRHGRAKDEVFCAPCAAAGLVTMPPFTSTGGRGMKPSINGVPPIYVIPGGTTLFQSLAASLLLPNKWPPAATPNSDAPWWTRDGLVGKDVPLREVGYVQSLTWPARRVRLRPELMGQPCTRCGQTTRWGVRDILYEMGELRPKGAAPWLDPFAAYTVQEKAEAPRPIRPRQGRVFHRLLQRRHDIRPHLHEGLAAIRTQPLIKGRHLLLVRYPLHIRSCNAGLDRKIPGQIIQIAVQHRGDHSVPPRGIQRLPHLCHVGRVGIKCHD